MENKKPKRLALPSLYNLRSKTHQNKCPNLVTLVQGIYPTFDIQIENCCDSEYGEFSTEFDLLPIEKRHGSLHGLYLINGNIADSEILFSYKSKYYELDLKNGQLSETQKKADKIILQLEKVKDCYLNPRTKTRKLKVPFLKLKENPEETPLVLAYENGEEISYRSLHMKRSRVYTSEINLGNVKKSLDETTMGFFNREEEVIYEEDCKEHNLKSNNGYLKIKPEKVNLNEPSQIYNFLRQFVVGQDDALKTVSIGVSEFINRDADQYSPHNILIAGMSGSGKTHIINSLEKLLPNIPFFKTQASGKSAEGYIGSSFTEIFREIYDQTGESEPVAILLIDEICKVRAKDSSSMSESVSDILIGALDQNGKYSFGGETIYFKNMLFISAGAFMGQGSNDSLEAIIKKRKKKENKIGFNETKEKKNLDEREEPIVDDFIEYGMKPELMGRFPHFARTYCLNPEELMEILNKKNISPLEEKRKSLKKRGYTLSIEQKVLKILVENADKKTGARSLRNSINRAFKEILFEPKEFASKGKKITINETLIRKLLET
ncbi:AAA domain-containing protein [Candidatus Woesearchaeota archaeon]|jgi:ATP-dependent Clp protease ATP-binding subunit ClpX|nr:AAA domain-containing protein [Candidatus Woesearchaeota archaeon]MBT4387871.1 AAA domain-containing protein [Candidatus Woesearchaeota archaeon]MBT4595690.1 AAA domain-containing protein [Candidatus Woesearchaeota archaeon]MBT5740691.1 AAA domain-containing protein [Candidatus Woesearchaeota archaeon]MBT6506039.1 AAA domain-containing protein [Candidatus Woesearchaeota archaeon]